jgi:hypothetical protein
VGDINMRRGFLDKRGCIETTFRLKHEKDKEVRGDPNMFHTKRRHLLSPSLSLGFPPRETAIF